MYKMYINEFDSMFSENLQKAKTTDAYSAHGLHLGSSCKNMVLMSLLTTLGPKRSPFYKKYSPYFQHRFTRALTVRFMSVLTRNTDFIDTFLCAQAAPSPVTSLCDLSRWVAIVLNCAAVTEPCIVDLKTITCLTFGTLGLSTRHEALGGLFRTPPL